MREAHRRFVTALLMTTALLVSVRPIAARQARQPATGLTSYVDPFVGVDNGGNTVPGAKLPFGFADPSPDTLKHDTSGYDSGQPIIGFSQTHVSGTGGGSKYGNFRITPLVGDLHVADLASPKSEESAAPGYYAVRLTRPDVRAELTATRFAAFHRYTFPRTGQAHLLVDASSAVKVGDFQPQTPIDCTARVVNSNRIEGNGNFANGWNAGLYTLHFAAEFSRPFAAYGTWRGERIDRGRRLGNGERTNVGAYATFDTTGDPVVTVRIGVSWVSAAKARESLEREIGAADFDEVRRRAAAEWEDALAKIKVEGGSEDERRIFYTALYRSHYMPHDLTGENVWWRSDEPHYEDYYCLWDTFRTLHPLLTLIQPERQRDMVRSMVDTYKHTGWMPDARIAGNNGLTQGGSNADVLVADAYVKGLQGIDYRAAYESMRKNADVDSPRPHYEGREIGDYVSRGYLSTDYARSASRTVEYAYNDFVTAQMAKAFGDARDHARLLARSRNWANLWDDETRSIRPRNPDGTWLAPYAATHVFPDDDYAWWGAPYYEGSGYQYSTYVPHDAAGLIAKLGGDRPFVEWLDRFFANAATGDKLFNGGLYTQNNEPDILASFLYLHAGRPDRTQEQVRRILETEYRTGRRGLPGNDDAGTMSSWYVWNAVGLYPNAGQPFYYIGSPIFTRAAIDLGQRRTFTVEAPATSPENKYIQSATLDGRPLGRAWLTHDEIMRGRRLVLRMGARPSAWGADERPPSMSAAAQARL